MSKLKLHVGPEDFLGRSVSQKKYAKQAQSRGKLHPRSLHPKVGESAISVDKLNRSESGECEFTEEHVAVAESREGTFYGWGFFTRNEVESTTPCAVKPEPIKQNPNHIIIEFPDTVKTCKKKRNEIAQELANLSIWLMYRDPTIESLDS